MSEPVISPAAYAQDEHGNVVEFGDPAARYVFCGEGSTLEGDRADKYQSYVAAHPDSHYIPPNAASEAVVTDPPASK